jgi:hypothetical protein
MTLSTESAGVSLLIQAPDTGREHSTASATLTLLIISAADLSWAFFLESGRDEGILVGAVAARRRRIIRRNRCALGLWAPSPVGVCRIDWTTLPKIMR